MICAPAYQDSVSTLEAKFLNYSEESFRGFCGDHCFKELPLAMSATKIAVASRHTDSGEAILLAWKGIVMIRNRARNGESKLLAEIEFPESEGFGLEVA